MNKKPVLLNKTAGSWLAGSAALELCIFLNPQLLRSSVYHCLQLIIVFQSQLGYELEVTSTGGSSLVIWDRERGWLEGGEVVGALIEEIDAVKAPEV